MAIIVSHRRVWSFVQRAIAVTLLVLIAVCITGCELAFPVAADSVDSAVYQLKIVMLDVGQGDSILLASGGQYILVDAGENDKGEDVVAMLQEMGVTSLKAVVGTHPHSDHIGGLDDVIAAFPVETVYLPRLTADTETYEDLLDAVDAAGLAITAPQPGDRMELGQAEITFLWPPARYDSSNANNHSIVLMVSAGGRDVLLCGDLEKGGENDLMEMGFDLDCDVLKVAHHGSDTCSTKAFLKAVSPRIALISVGEGNSYKHPGKDALKRLADAGARIHRTDQEGTLTVTLVDGEIVVSSQ